MKSWLNASKVYLDRRVMVIGFLGFSSGLPLLLIFSTLSVWLKMEGVSLTAIGLFSLVRTPYTFKFLWAPVIDRAPIPFLSKWLGRRRSWALVSQLALIAAIFSMASTSPSEAPFTTALFALLVAFCSASQDVVIDAYRVESLASGQQGAGAGVIVLGYRIGILAAGAGSLWLASVLSWNDVYRVMAGLVVVGVITVLVAREPEADAEPSDGDIHSWFFRAVVAPFGDFISRPGWRAALVFIMFYKMGEAYLGVMANPFYVEIGFSTVEIANVSKLFGLGATLIGALAGGIMVSRYGIMKSLMIAGILQIGGTLAFSLQAIAGHNIYALMFTIAAENATSGMATSAFVAYLSGLCNPAYTATQYALLSSIMALSRDVLSASSGWFAEHLGWIWFFIFSAAIAVPGLLILLWLMRHEPATQGRARGYFS